MRASFRFRSLVLCIGSGIFGFWALPTKGAERPLPYDAEAQVRLWDGLVTTRKDRYEIVVVEPFENLRRWKSRAASTPLDEIRYVFKTPNERAFQLDKDLLHAWAPDDLEFEQSLLVHTNFSVPGEQVYAAYPDRPIPIKGLPERMCLWVHSEGYHHRLVFIFRNADDREVRVELPPLIWKGWRRVDVNLPDALKRRGRRAGHHTGAHLTGFLIESHRLSGAGEVAVLLDNLAILTDTVDLRYPGSEIPDQWPTR